MLNCFGNFTTKKNFVSKFRTAATFNRFGLVLLSLALFFFYVSWSLLFCTESRKVYIKCDSVKLLCWKLFSFCLRFEELPNCSEAKRICLFNFGQGKYRSNGAKRQKIELSFCSIHTFKRKSFIIRLPFSHTKRFFN